MTNSYNEGLEAALAKAERYASECENGLVFYPPDDPFRRLQEGHVQASKAIVEEIRALKQEEAVDIPEPVYKSVERILDEHSAWIARPNKDVTQAVALAATIAAFHALEQPEAPDPRDALIKELVGALVAAQVAMSDGGIPSTPFVTDALSKIDVTLSKAKGVVDASA